MYFSNVRNLKITGLEMCLKGNKNENILVNYQNVWEKKGSVL